MEYEIRLTKKLKELKNSKSETRDLLEQIKLWQDEFDSEASYGTSVDYNNAKDKYILMKWEEWNPKNNKKSFCVRGTYEDEELGTWYCCEKSILKNKK